MGKKVKQEIVACKLSPRDLYQHCAAWRRAKNTIKMEEAKLEIEKPLILGHYLATGTKNFVWDTINVSVVAGTPAKVEPDAKAFMTYAREYMTPEQYAECLERSMKEIAAKDPYLR